MPHLWRLTGRIGADHALNRRRRREPDFLSHCRTRPLAEHLRAAIAWLRLSHAVTGGQGSSKGFSYLHGWLPTFPETTGYIAPTLLRYAEMTGERGCRDEAFRMLDFLCRVRGADGGVMEGVWQPNRAPARSIVFNTGMALSGWLAGHRASGGRRYLDVARKAGDFLCEIRGDEALWLEHCYNHIPHAYHARVAWFLARLGRRTGEARYAETARDILDWVLAQQQENGWFEHCHFTDRRPTYNTHGLAYTLRGLLEGGLILERPDYLQAVLKTTAVVRARFDATGFLPALLDRDWRPRARSECVTGIAQHALVWMRLHDLTGDPALLASAIRATDLVCALQDLASDRPEIRGAIKGSQPIWGRYAPLQYPNWAAKFFADALMLRLRIEGEGPAGWPGRPLLDAVSAPPAPDQLAD